MTGAWWTFRRQQRPRCRSAGPADIFIPFSLVLFQKAFPGCHTSLQHSELTAARIEPPLSPQALRNSGPGSALGFSGARSRAALMRRTHLHICSLAMTQLLSTWASPKRPACHGSAVSSTATTPLRLHLRNPSVHSPRVLLGSRARLGSVRARTPQRHECQDHRGDWPSPQASFTSNIFEATHFNEFFSKHLVQCSWKNSLFEFIFYHLCAFHYTMSL